MLKIVCNILLFSLFVSMAYASVPEDLMQHSKPIDALCFFNMEGNSTTINLNNCGRSKYKYVIKGHNAILSKKGFIGYDWQDPSLKGATQGYSYYKIFNVGNHRFWIYTVNSGGGTGEFTAIQLVERKNANTLGTQAIIGGDRCNGGLQHVSEKNHQLTYSVNLTAYDLMGLAQNHNPSLKAYDDLAACAVCCVAKAVYTVGVDSKPQLQHIVLGNFKNTEEMPSQGKRQACFNTLLASYTKSGKMHFKQNTLNAFVNKFNQTCNSIKEIQDVKIK
jgi:hypothetical protein